MFTFVKTAHKIKFYGLALYYLVVVILAYPVLLSRAQSCPQPQTPAFAKCSVVYYTGLSSFAVPTITETVSLQASSPVTIKP